MNLDRERARQLLNDFDLETLFTQEIGWDHHSQTLPIQINEAEYTLTACAEKRGMVVFSYTADPKAHIPDYATRRKIERQVAKSVREHLIIYTDNLNTTQVWQWVKREIGKPDACREHRYWQEQPADSLIEKLDQIAISIQEEEAGLTLIDLLGNLKSAFDVEKVTKRFYDHFEKEHDVFLQFLKGIPDEGLQRWYASIVLNRLMFIYFIQKKRFLDNDLDYLRKKLQHSQAAGKDRYYKAFLCPLFFEGFAKPIAERSREMELLLGNVSYLNGGIFQRHQIEKLHGETIQIPDAAFERLFNFFDRYQWRLDDRPRRNDSEINPDVLGYIFEKYINRKQMGAYYTKEDITDYISKNTIIPFILDSARKNCKIAFGPPIEARSTHNSSPTVWQLLVEKPDDYIYPSVQYGIDTPLPPEITAGIDDVSKRSEWNVSAPSAYALKTEIWREVVARRARYHEVHAKLINGKIHDVDDLVTYNLNTRQFAQDIIENCEGPDLLRAFWKAIKAVTVLDPTCGSGAFLFAALNVLAPLYEACLDRMQVFLEELRDSSERQHSKKYTDFREILNRVNEHPNRNYFILKSIIINNLYGVDIMKEAIEICKLRLYLKLVAQVKNADQIEPLPDIDFNIQAGNTLVGFATYEQVKEAFRSQIDVNITMNRIKENVEDVDRLFALFREQQTELGGDVVLADKKALQDKLEDMHAQLNRYLAGEYGIEPNNKPVYDAWLDSHKPFHWFIQFYGILKNGGFDVIIGNPPYVEYSKVKKQYAVSKYKTERCGNLYAMSIERSMDLAEGPIGMIVQLPLVCTDRMIPAQTLFKNSDRKSWFANFDDRPGKLFDDLQHIRATIFLSKQDRELNIAEPYATKYNRWFTEARPILFEGVTYGAIADISFNGAFPKIGDSIAKRIATKLNNAKNSPSNFTTGNFACHFHNTPQYWIRAMDFIPYFWSERDGEKITSHIKTLYLTNELDASVVIAVLNSSLFYWWFVVLSNCRDLTLREIRTFPTGVNEIPRQTKEKLAMVVADLMTDLKHHAQRKKANYKTTGRVVYDEFFPRHSKPIIDEIDRILAEHFGFTDEELDFIINYDIKYRMGLGSSN